MAESRPVSRSGLNWRALAEELANGHRRRSDEHPIGYYVNREESKAILAALRYVAVSEPTASPYDLNGEKEHPGE